MILKYIYINFNTHTILNIKKIMYASEKINKS